MTSIPSLVPISPSKGGGLFLYQGSGIPSYWLGKGDCPSQVTLALKHQNKACLSESGACPGPFRT